MAIRLRGADPDGSGDRAIEIGAITAHISGALIAVSDLRVGLLDVTRDSAYTIGSLAVPEGTARVDVRIPVLGGRVGGQTADACSRPIDFRFDPAKVEPPRCHVVVQLDRWSFSALATASTPRPVIVPAFTVRY